MNLRAHPLSLLLALLILACRASVALGEGYEVAQAPAAADPWGYFSSLVRG